MSSDTNEMTFTIHTNPFKQSTIVSLNHTTYRKQNCPIDHTMNIKQHHVTTETIEPYVRTRTMLTRS